MRWGSLLTFLPIITIITRKIVKYWNGPQKFMENRITKYITFELVFNVNFCSQSNNFFSDFLHFYN